MTQHAIKKLASRLIPWLIAVGIFYFLFQKYSFSQVWAATQYANLPAFLLLAVAYFLFQYVVDSAITAKTLRRFGHPVTLRDILPARGVSYLVMILNYAASQGAFAYYLKRKREIPIFDALGIFLFIMLIDLYWVIGMAFVGSFFQDTPVNGVDLGYFVRVFTLVAAAAALLHLAFWRGWLRRIGVTPDRKLFAWLTRRRLFAIFGEARVADYLRLAWWRTPIHISIILTMYFLILTFNANLPFTAVLSNIPIAFLIGAVPITPGGIGTTNAAMVALLHPYVQSPLIGNGEISAETLILAASLAWMVANYLLKGIIGLVWLIRIPKDLFDPAAAEY